jgi:AraC-like DNA-binding protein
VPPTVAWYREFAPCDALRDDVYAFFSFVPVPRPPLTARPLLREVAFHEATFCSPQLADGQVSLLFELGRTCDATGRWNLDAAALRGTFTGPMSRVGRTSGTDRPEMLGVYFRPGRAAPFLRVPIADLTDAVADVGSVWSGSASLASELCELDEMSRIARVESALLARLALTQRSGSVGVDRLAARMVRRRGGETVESLACGAGISRQHLSRLFRERVGVGPKLYNRLARFQAGLVYAGAGTVDWAEAAIGLGYADQSHMIAEVREFSGLTPHALASRQWFHPFIERARPPAGQERALRLAWAESAMEHTSARNTPGIATR